MHLAIYEISKQICNFYVLKCIISMQVFFSELGWGDRILRPDSFDINYCLGICHFPQISSPKYNTTKHSHIQSIAAHYNPDYVPTPCCVPHEYSDVEILYEELSGMFVKYVLTDVAVKSCGCKWLSHPTQMSVYNSCCVVLNYIQYIIYREILWKYYLLHASHLSSLLSTTYSQSSH